MKIFIKKIVVVCCLFMSISKSTQAQKDTIFWFAAPEVSASVGDNPVILRFLSYQAPSVITITQPANGLFVPVVINLPANSIDSFNLTPFLSSIESPAANIVAANGIKISSTSEITVYSNNTSQLCCGVGLVM